MKERILIISKTLLILSHKHTHTHTHTSSTPPHVPSSPLHHITHHSQLRHRTVRLIACHTIPLILARVACQPVRAAGPPSHVRRCIQIKQRQHLCLWHRRIASRYTHHTQHHHNSQTHTSSHWNTHTTNNPETIDHKPNHNHCPSCVVVIFRGRYSWTRSIGCQGYTWGYDWTKGICLRLLHALFGSCWSHEFPACPNHKPGSSGWNCLLLPFPSRAFRHFTTFSCPLVLCSHC